MAFEALFQMSFDCLELLVELTLAMVAGSLVIHLGFMGGRLMAALFMTGLVPRRVRQSHTSGKHPDNRQQRQPSHHPCPRFTVSIAATVTMINAAT